MTDRSPRRKSAGPGPATTIPDAGRPLALDRVRASGPRVEQRDSARVERLAERAACGDSEAFALIYIEHRAEIRALARRLLRNDHDADEATQQAFLHAFRAVPSYDPARGSFGAWLHQIAINHIIHVKRRRARYDLADLETIEAAINDRDFTRTLDLLAAEGFRNLLGRLSRDQRAVIVLRYQFDWTVTDIARQLGTTPDAISHLHSRALRQLRARSTDARTPRSASDK